MNKPRGGPNDALSPAGQYIHDAGYYAIGGVVITTKWDADAQRHRIMFVADKEPHQDVTFGHESTFDALARAIPHSRFVILRMKNGKPYQEYREGDWRQFTDLQFNARLTKWATPR